MQEVSESKQGEVGVHGEGQLSVEHQISSRMKRVPTQTVHRLKLWHKVLELKKGKKEVCRVGGWEGGLKWRIRAKSRERRTSHRRRDVGTGRLVAYNRGIHHIIK